MNARLFLAALFFGAFFLAFCLILALWPTEPEPSRVVSQHAVNIAGASTFYDSLTTTTTVPPTTTEVARSAPKRTEQNKRPRETRVQAVGIWDALASCESNGRWNLNTGNGYYGGLQFAAATWAQAGGHRYAPNAHLASRGQQIAIAESWLARTSWAQWPICSKRLGLR